jgi:hypothetical protein
MIAERGFPIIAPRARFCKNSMVIPYIKRPGRQPVSKKMQIAGNPLKRLGSEK